MISSPVTIGAAFISVLVLIAAMVLSTRQDAIRIEIEKACSYLHKDDRGAELVCRENPPWREKE